MKHKKLTVIFWLLLSLLALAATACKKPDIQGKWRLTLKWDERAVFSGAPPPPTVEEVILKEGKIYRAHDANPIGVYFQKRGQKIRLKLPHIKVILYGELSDKDRMEGDISYFPVSEYFGTFIAARISLLKKE